jgi:hypothetical protein
MHAWSPQHQINLSLKEKMEKLSPMEKLHKYKMQAASSNWKPNLGGRLPAQFEERYPYTAASYYSSSSSRMVTLSHLVSRLRI